MAESHHHSIPIRTLAGVFGALIVLTIVTVVASQINLGVLNVPMALAIAGGKAILVALIFMALKYDNRVNTMILTLGVVFAVVFLALTLTDTELRGVLGITEPGTTLVAGDQNAEEEQPPEPPAVVSASVMNPEETFQTYCAQCHDFSAETTLPGPSLLNLGSRQPPDSIRTSILEPDATIVDGYPALLMSMTLNALGFQSKVNEASVDTLVAWLATQ